MKERMYGVLMLIASATVPLLTGDATALVLTVPIGILLIVKPQIAGATATKKEVKKMVNYEIRYVRGHYEVYMSGEFLCSGDTPRECLDALDELAPCDAA